MAKGQRLEAKPTAKVVLSGVNTKDEVLVTDPVSAFPVYSRLYRGHHPGQQGLLVEALPDVLRTFMHIQIETDAMTCPMSEITH